MAKVKVKLLHRCNKEGCKGKKGDVVEVDEKLAKEWIASNGAVEVNAKGEAKS